MKKALIIIIIISLSVMPLCADEFLKLVPGGIIVFEDSEMPPSYGFSLKNIGNLNNSYYSLGSFEIRGAFNFDNEKYMIDLTWPSFFGFFAPGFSLDYNDDGFTPWFLAELDLFYFPFAFATIIAFEKPVFIPSAYLAFKFGPEGDKLDAGIRISFPIYKKGDKD